MTRVLYGTAKSVGKEYAICHLLNEGVWLLTDNATQAAWLFFLKEVHLAVPCANVQVLREKMVSLFAERRCDMIT